MDSTGTELGPYVYDPNQPFVISATSSTLATAVTPSSGRLMSLVGGGNSFPDSYGWLVLGFGTQFQEVVPYVSRPDNYTLLLSSSYTLKYNHDIGSDVCLLSSNTLVDLSQTGDDYQTYISDVAGAREYSQTVMQSVLAAGIQSVFTVTYPSDVGLTLAGTPLSSKYIVWGGDQL